jgi:hypothetical protein
VEGLISGELAYPFSVIPSDALRDRAADGEHLITRITKALTNMEMSQVHAAAAQCDLHRGMAAVLPAEKVFFSPYPLARTCVVAAAKAWFILGGATREERLQRYLNEELATLYGASWDFTDPASCADIAALADDHVAVGATAGLQAVRMKNRKHWVAPYLVRSDQHDRDSRRRRPPSCGRCSAVRCVRVDLHRPNRVRHSDDRAALVDRDDGQGDGARRDRDADPAPGTGPVRERA